MKRAALLAIVLLAGCASAPPLPPCANVDLSAVETPQGTLFVFTTPQMAALARALPAGMCRLEMTNWVQSTQIEHPYGWVAIDLEYIA